MRITVLAGGIGGARFVRGLLQHLAHAASGEPSDVTVVANTADDITLHGLRVCPDLDTLMYTLGGGVHPEQGWGRDGETFAVADELAAYGAGPDWFTLGDRDIATHLVRSRMLGLGYPLSQVTAALCARWDTGVTLLPMSDDPIETHVVVDTAAVRDASDEGGPDEGGPDEGGPDAGRTAIHFQEWWVRWHAVPAAHQIVAVGAEQATAGPGVLDALRGADVVLLPPSNPVVSVGTILSVPGVRDALRGTRAPVVGVSPIIGSTPVRGMADACLRAIGVESSPMGVAGLYADLLDGWLVDSSDGHLDGRTVARGRAAVRAVPLLMSDVEATAEIARAALDLALETTA